jgi:hypothetical protein
MANCRDPSPNKRQPLYQRGKFSIREISLYGLLETKNIKPRLSKKSLELAFSVSLPKTPNVPEEELIAHEGKGSPPYQQSGFLSLLSPSQLGPWLRHGLEAMRVEEQLQIGTPSLLERRDGPAPVALHLLQGSLGQVLEHVEPIIVQPETPSPV